MKNPISKLVTWWRAREAKAICDEARRAHEAREITTREMHARMAATLEPKKGKKSGSKS